MFQKDKYFLIILGAVLIFIAGFYFRSLFIVPTPQESPSPTSLQISALEKKASENGLVRYEEITVVGQITKVGNFEIWLKAANGEEAKIVLAGEVVIYRAGQGSLNFSQAKLKEGEKAMISLARRGEKFVASTISILE